MRRPLVSVGVDDSSSSGVVARRVAPPIRAVVLERRAQALDDRLESEGLVAPGGEEGVELEARSTPVVVRVVVDDYCSAERRLADARRASPRGVHQSKPHAGLVRAVAADDHVHVQRRFTVADRLARRRQIDAGAAPRRRDREDRSLDARDRRVELVPEARRDGGSRRRRARGRMQ